MATDGWDYSKDSSDSTGVGKFLKSPTMRSLMTEHAEIAVSLYRSRVRQRTGENAREVRVHTEIGGRRHDRWVAVVTAYAPHALAREFGNSRNRTPEHTLRDVARDLESGF
ncbi:hypothetical protein [Rhodococcus jostii]|uniref:hypothetical protein n=1 Tax=Rhodococcus jostii TaxID=132919 RepID=UPI003643A01A